jgi:zinc transport system ATP-binding protein
MIKLNNISLGYDNKIIIKDMTLNIKEGSYVAIVGENGAGKSTLIKGILGLIKPKRGTGFNACSSFLL